MNEIQLLFCIQNNIAAKLSQMEKDLSGYKILDVKRADFDEEDFLVKINSQIFNTTVRMAKKINYWEQWIKSTQQI